MDECFSFIISLTDVCTAQMTEQTSSCVQHVPCLYPPGWPVRYGVLVLVVGGHARHHHRHHRHQGHPQQQPRQIEHSCLQKFLQRSKTQKSI